MKRVISWFALLFFVGTAYGNQCSTVFTGPVSSSVAGGELRIERNARIAGTNGFVDFSRIRDNSQGSSCNSQACQLSGNLAKRPYLPSFDASSSSFDITFPRNSRVTLPASDYDDVRLERDSILTFDSENQTYRFDTLRIRRNSTLNLSSGTYYIRDLTIERDVNIVVESGNTVVMYVNRLNLQRNARLNGGGTPGQLLVVAYDRITLAQDTLVNGFLYATSSIRMNRNMRLTGAANARNIRIDRDAFVNFDASTIGNLHDDSICNDAPDETGSQVAFYEFDDDNWNAESDVIDSLDNYNGSALFGNQPFISESPVSCSVLAVGDNTNNETHGIDTQLDINDLGESGTISFWYKNNENWKGNGSKQLLDASDRGTGKYFYLSITSAGRFSFGMEDDTDGDFHYLSQENNIAADVWTHVTLAWNIARGEVDLYLDGQPITGTTQVNTLRTSTLGGLDTLVIGDNRSRYIVYSGTNDAANGEFDNVKIYDYRRPSDEVLTEYENEDDITPTCVELSHYEVTHPSQSLTCDSAEVTLKACANASCDELVSNEVTVNLSNGDWASGQSVSFTGTTVLSLSQSSVGEHNVTVTGTNSASMAANPTECSDNCTIDFVNAGFQFYNSATPYDTVLPATIAGSDLGAVGLRAVQDNGGQCQALLSGNQTVTLGFDCVSTNGADYTSTSCRVPFAGINVNGDGSGVSSGTVTLNFNNDGETTLSGLSYEDASRLALTATSTIDGVTIDSGSVTLDSVPADLLISATPSGRYVAGVQFDLSITARGASGATLPSYSPGNLRARLTRLQPSSVSAAEGVLTLSSNVAVTSQTAAVFQDIAIGNWLDGVYSDASASVSEVGTFQFEVDDNGYLGQTVSAVSSVDLGQFIPAYFDVTEAVTPTIESQCSTFTYVGQPFDYAIGQEPTFTVTPYNGRGVVTQNYSGDQITLSPSTNQLAYTDNQNYAGGLSVPTSGSVSISANQSEGFDISVLSSELAFDKAPSPSNPFTLDLDLTASAAFFTDADGVCYQSNYPMSGCDSYRVNNITGTELRYGRVRLENTFGPEDATLSVPVLADYYLADAWAINRQDSCTALNLAQSSGQITIADGSEGEFESDITALLSSTSISGSLTSGQSATDTFLLGPALSDGVAQRGTVAVSLEPGAGNPSWANFLNIDWNLDGQIDVNDKPSASVSFGHYRGNDRTLNWREQFE